jgi:hypothetical protein
MKLTEDALRAQNLVDSRPIWQFLTPLVHPTGQSGDQFRTPRPAILRGRFPTVVTIVGLLF